MDREPHACVIGAPESTIRDTVTVLHGLGTCSTWAQTIPHIDAQYATGVSRRGVENALIAAGKDLGHLAPEDLWLLEDFHTMGRIATTQLVDLIGITSETEVLDAGTGSAVLRVSWQTGVSAGLPPSISPRSTAKRPVGSIGLSDWTTGSPFARQTSPTCLSPERLSTSSSASMFR